jgi:Tfp pilus assembly protein PilF
MGTWGFSPGEEVIPKARAAALKALEIDENHAGALTTLALINETIDLDGRTAEDRFRKAIELEPNYATAHQWYAELLTFEGRSAEAIAEISLARKLDPRSLIIATDQGWFLSYARQYDRAIKEFRKVLAIDPKFSRANGGLVAAYMFQGRFDEALVEIHRWMQFSDEPYPWAMAVYVHARRGELAKARETLRQAEDRYRRLNMDPSGARGGMLLGLGLKEEVFALMQKACKEHPGTLRTVKVEPLYDPLRNDPRFEQLIRCAHLEP